MSKDNRTFNDLFDNLSSEYSWRLKELNDYKSTLKSANPEYQKTLIRGGITLIYAHWEGFVRAACENFYNYVVLQKHSLNELKESFVAISLRRYINLLLITNKISLQSESIRFIRDKGVERASFPNSLPIKTSNLSYEVLEDYCYMLGINIKQFELKRIFININLVKNRNLIAHGNYLSINLKEFYEIYDTTIKLLDEIKTEILNSASTKKYINIEG